MAIISDIIQSAFGENGYKGVKSFGGMDILKHEHYEDYWIVCWEGFNMSQQHDIYEIVVKGIVEEHPYAAKNTSILYLSDLTKEQLSTDQIVEIEKDPFFFKKYVFAYSDELAAHLLELMQGKGCKDVSEFIMQPESFYALNEENTYGVYHLAYSLMHKLPFLPIKAEQKGLKPRDFFFDSPEECNALDEVMSLVGDVQAVYDSLKSMIEHEVDEQH